MECLFWPTCQLAAGAPGAKAAKAKEYVPHAVWESGLDEVPVYGPIRF